MLRQGGRRDCSEGQWRVHHGILLVSLFVLERVLVLEEISVAKPGLEDL